MTFAHSSLVPVKCHLFSRRIKQTSKQTPDNSGQITCFEDRYEDSKPVVLYTMAHTIITSFKACCPVFPASTGKNSK